MKNKIKQILSAIVAVIFLLLAIGSKNNSNDNTSTVNDTESCLVGYDWVYPSASNPSNAWKFSSNGSFNYSTTRFGGMSAWGNWTILSPGKIKVSYTSTTEGIIPDEKIIIMSSCSSLKVGSTYYSKM